MIDDTREEYLRGAGTEADREEGPGADRGGRDAGLPGPRDEAGNDRGAEDNGGSRPEADDGATAPITDPRPTS